MLVRDEVVVWFWNVVLEKEEEWTEEGIYVTYHGADHWGFSNGMRSLCSEKLPRIPDPQRRLRNLV